MNSISFLKDEIITTIKTNQGDAFRKSIAQLEKAVIEEALILCRGNQTEAARILGINRGTLRKKGGL